jgi:hypothetical protein
MNQEKTAKVVRFGVPAVLFSLLLNCYSSPTRGTLLAYYGERQSHEKVACLIKAKDFWGTCFCKPTFGWWILKDTVEFVPGQVEMQIQHGPVPYDRTVYYSQYPHITNQRSGGGNIVWPGLPWRSTPAKRPNPPYCQWTLKFTAEAGHMYDLKVGQGNVLVLIDRTSRDSSYASPSNGPCQLCK